MLKTRCAPFLLLALVFMLSACRADPAEWKRDMLDRMNAQSSWTEYRVEGYWEFDRDLASLLKPTGPLQSRLLEGTRGLAWQGTVWTETGQVKADVTIRREDRTTQLSVLNSGDTWFFQWPGLTRQGEFMAWPSESSIPAPVNSPEVSWAMAVLSEIPAEHYERAESATDDKDAAFDVTVRIPPEYYPKLWTALQAAAGWPLPDWDTLDGAEEARPGEMTLYAVPGETYGYDLTLKLGERTIRTGAKRHKPDPARTGQPPERPERVISLPAILDSLLNPPEPPKPKNYVEDFQSGVQLEVPEYREDSTEQAVLQTIRTALEAIVDQDPTTFKSVFRSPEDAATDWATLTRYRIYRFTDMEDLRTITWNGRTTVGVTFEYVDRRLPERPPLTSAFRVTVDRSDKAHWNIIHIE